MVGGERMWHNCNYNTQKMFLYLSQTNYKHFFHQQATFELRKNHTIITESPVNKIMLLQ